MSRDRLAAMRAQQQGGQNNYNDENSGGGYSRRPNPYAQQDDGYEMRGVGASQPSNSYASSGGGAPAAGGGDISSFYSEISSIQDQIKRFNDNVNQISTLHSRSLNNTDEAAAQRNTAELDQMMNDTSNLSNQLRQRIKSLEKKGFSGSDGQIRKQQTGLVKSKFVEAIQNYQQVEQQYRSRYKQRMERQFKIVKPNATPEEVKAVVNDEGGGQIFQQALMNSNRYGESRAAYREVQERHQDIKRIEKTLNELAQLFQDMSMLVQQQDEQLDAIQVNAVNVNKDVEVGLQHTEKAVVSARGARKKRWICFFLTLIILAVIIIIVIVVLHNAGIIGGKKN